MDKQQRKKILPSGDGNDLNWNFLNRTDRFFAGMVSSMTVAQFDPGRRFVSHPSGWRFVVERGWMGAIVLAARPHHRLNFADRLVDGPPAIRVMELLEVMV